VTHQHGPDGEHAHRSIAFTTWIDPGLAVEQAESVRDALARRRPDLQDEFDSGLGALTAQLDELDREFQATFERIGDRPILFSHPVYQYLIQRYSINARSLHWEPDSVLTESDINDLSGILESHPATLMIWEGEPIDSARQTLLSHGIRSVVYSTAANTPASGDYISVMQTNLDDLRSAL